MKTLIVLASLLASLFTHAANPSFGQFNTNDFTVVNGVSISVGPSILRTNSNLPAAQLTGTVPNAALTGAGITNVSFFASAAPNFKLSIQTNGSINLNRANDGTLYTLVDQFGNVTARTFNVGLRGIDSTGSINANNATASGTSTATNGFITPVAASSSIIVGVTNGASINWNSNGTIYVVTSKVGATNQAFTKIADAAP